MAKKKTKTHNLFYNNFEIIKIIYFILYNKYLTLLFQENESERYT